MGDSGMYVAAALHQLKVAVSSVSDIFACMTDQLLEEKPFLEKRSVGELASHLSILIPADLLIMNGSSKEEMEQFYRENNPQTLADMEKALVSGYERLVAMYNSYGENELMEMANSYWGVSYTKFEWLVEIVGHFYHHRAQLHMMLTASHVRMQVPLFE